VGVLDAILTRKRADVAERKRAVPLEVLRVGPASVSPERDFASPLRGASGVRAICEIKRRSPSGGAIRPDLRPADIAIEYARSGAAALSVLTEHYHFGGSDDDLRAARAATTLPTLRKDFTVDEYQLYESRAIGADAVLLIVRVLSDAQLCEYLTICGEIGLAALVEAHDAGEIERAAAAGATIIGVNNRDLETLETRLDTCLELRRLIPTGALAVAESGIKTRDDVRRIRDAGYDAILVGESLLRQPLVGAALRELLDGQEGGVA